MPLALPLLAPGCATDLDDDVDVAVAVQPLSGGTGLLPVNSTVLVYEPFETSASLSAWTQAGTVGFHTGVYKFGRGSAMLRQGGSVTRSIPVTGKHGITIATSIDGYGFSGSESVVGEYRINGGAWTSMMSLLRAEADGYYQYRLATLPDPGGGYSSLDVRYRTTGFTTTQYAFLDEINVYGQNVGGPVTDPTSDCPSCIADFAVYDPTIEDDGVWEEETVALRAMFKAYNWTYQIVDHADLNAGYLGGTGGTPRKFRALIAPGGSSDKRNTAVTNEVKIRDFINNGGNYVGFCAGAYWPGTHVVVAMTPHGGNGTYNLSTDYTSYAYDLKLLNGDSKGPFGWFPWSGGTTATFEAAAIDTTNPTMAAIGIPAITRFVYGGGPFFTNLGAMSGLEVWARAIMPSGTPTAAQTGNNEPTVIKFNYGTGKVVLFAYHPDLLIQSTVDNLTISQYFYETSMVWNTGNQTMADVNLQSWNITHAAMQIAANETVTPLTILP